MAENGSNSNSNVDNGTVGIIQPPPDIRAVVDKTAQFVARNGEAFEKRIMNNEKNTTKFGFLQSDNPYNAYYKAKLREFVAQEAAEGEDAMVKPAGNALATATATTSETIGTTATVASQLPEKTAKVQEQLKKRRPLVEPPPDQFTVKLPKGLHVNAIDIDTIKWTAQCAARNGRSFLNGLLTREARNPNFEFLKGHHILFNYFTSLVEAYSKVLSAPKATLDILQQNSENKFDLLEKALSRLEWEQHHDAMKKSKELQEKAERQQAAMIDWHDFKIVECIDFLDIEDKDLPAPLQLHELEHITKTIMPVVEPPPPPPQSQPPPPPPPPEEHDTEMEMETDDMQVSNDNMAVEADLTDENIKIYKNYVRPTTTASKVAETLQYQICPRCGQKVPVDEMQEHIRIELLDPRWREYRSLDKSKLVDSSLAEGDEISRNLRILSKRRRDIFGDEVDITADPKATYSGGQPSSQSSSNASAMAVAAANEIKDASNKPPTQLPGATPPPPSYAPPPPQIPMTTAPSAYSAQSGFPRPPAPMSMYDPYADAKRSKMEMQPPPYMGYPPAPPGPPSMMGYPPSQPPPPPGMAYPPPPSAMGYPPSQPPPPPGPPPPGMGFPGGPPGGYMAPPPGGYPMGMPYMGGMPAPGQLIPEADYMAMRPGPREVQVAVPNDPEKAEWNFSGQMLRITLDIGASISTLKNEIGNRIGMPANKQKLTSLQHGVLKDGSTLAAYNYENEVFQLDVKTRGGKKK